MAEKSDKGSVEKRHIERSTHTKLVWCVNKRIVNSCQREMLTPSSNEHLLWQLKELDIADQVKRTYLNNSDLSVQTTASRTYAESSAGEMFLRGE